MLVTTIANMLGAVEDEISDIAGGQDLLALLPEVRDGVPTH
jgi:hypothetical protein